MKRLKTSQDEALIPSNVSLSDFSPAEQSAAFVLTEMMNFDPSKELASIHSTTPSQEEGGFQFQNADGAFVDAVRDFKARSFDSYPERLEAARQAAEVLRGKQRAAYRVRFNVPDMTPVTDDMVNATGEHDVRVRFFRAVQIARQEVKDVVPQARPGRRDRPRGGKLTAPTPLARQGKDWRVPIERCSRVPKPTSYDVKSFRRWVLGEAYALSLTITKPNYFVTGDTACERLFFGSSGPVQEWLQRARVYVDSYSADLRRPEPLRAVDFLSVLHIDGRPFTEDDLPRLAKWPDEMKAARYLVHLPRWRDNLSPGAVRLIESRLPTLQRFINVRFPLHPPRPVPQPVALPPSLETTQGPDVEPKYVQAARYPAYGAVRPFNPDVGDNLKSKAAVLSMRDRHAKLTQEFRAYARVNKYSYQGGAPSKPIVTLGADLAEQSLVAVYNRYERPAAQLAAFIASLCAADNWRQRAAAVAQFVTANDSLWRKAKWFITSMPETIRYQGAEASSLPAATPEERSWYERFVEFVVSSSILMTLKECATTTYEAIVAPIGSYLKTLKFTLEKTSASKIAEYIISTLEEIARRLKSCWTHKSFAPLWGADWDPVRWMKYARGIVTHASLLALGPAANPKDAEALKVLRASGDIPPWWTEAVLPSEYVRRLEVHIGVGRDLLKYFAKQPMVSHELGRCLVVCENALEQKRVAAYASNERMCPFFLVMYGPPGTGKTVLEAQIRNAVALKNGYDPSPQGTYVWVPGANFQTGLSYTNWAIKMDDVDHSVATPQAGVPTHIDSLCKLVNNNPYNVEEAAVETKGKVFANPMFVTYLTNFENGRVTDNISVPEAWWRRIDQYIRVVANQSYQSANGKLDPEKAARSETHDMYDIFVRYFDASLVNPSDRHCIPLTPEVKMSFPEFMVQLHERYQTKLARERNMLALRSEIGSHCPTCFLPLSRSCGHLVYQGQGAHLEGEESEEDESTYAQRCNARVINVGQRFRDRCLIVADSVRQFDWAAAIERTARAVEQQVATPSGLAAVAGLGAVIVAVGVAARSAIRFQAREANSTGAVPVNWFRADQVFTPGVPNTTHLATFTKEELVSTLQRCFVLITGPKFRTFGVCVGQNLLLVPTHVLNPFQEGMEVVVAHSGVELKVKLTGFEVMRVANQPELSLVKVANLGGRSSLAGKFWHIVDESVSSFDAVEVWGEGLHGKALSHKFSMTNCAGVQARVLTCELDPPTQEGDCGKVYIAQFGSAWKVIAMHFAGVDKFTMTGMVSLSVGGVISAVDITAAAKRLATTYQGVATPSRLLCKDVSYSLEKYPLRSEFWAAVSHHGAVAFPLGSIKPLLHGSSPKTRLQVSLVADDFRDLTEDWCGQQDYWGFPDFRGHMTSGETPVWESPYTNMFGAQNFAQPDSYYMWLALADYLSGMRKLDTEGYAVLSEEQAMSGVPGSIIGAFNMKTSVGPPFNRAKLNYMRVWGGESYMADELWAAYDDLVGVVAAGDVPSPVGICTLKDEPLKPGKKPRVFTCLPFVFNLLAKRHFAPIVAFMRANFTFFESAVGVNMTSSDAGRVVAHLRRVDPSLTKLVDADVKMMDKALSGFLMDYTALVYFAISTCLGLDSQASRNIFLGVKHTRFCIKNDLFSWFFNPSGWWETVGTNGIAISLGERYVYYRTRNGPLPSRDEVLAYARQFEADPFNIPFEARLDFRDNVALVHYGDDNVKAMDEIPAQYTYIWQTELGLEMTDASKTGEMRHKTLSEIEFLKRRFVFNAQLGVYMTPLSLKSLARTLMVKKESVLSAPDHAAVAMTEVMREAVYHGEEFYTMLRARCDAAAARHGLLQNGYYKSYSYAYWFDVMRSGNFSAWVPRENPELVEENFSF